jgi:hypothetical protein
MSAPQTLRELARIVRSKNSGPFELTFDVMFETQDIFERVRDSGAVTRASLSALYGVKEDQVTNFQFFEPALAFKLTLRRPRPQGAAGETDTFGAQQHAPLLGLLIPRG